MVRFLRLRLAADRAGVTALEYALIAAVMGLLIVTGATSLGSGLVTAFTDIGNLLIHDASGM